MSQKGIGGHRLAVLIDAENAQASLAPYLLSEIAKYGVASVKRIYGDWTKPQLGGWKETLLTHSIQPMQQFSYTTGKNATDSALIIDAMDLLYTAKFDGFCIVSSDSDFTRLAARIRESGLVVYGFGRRQTPKAFVAACDKFIYTEILKEERGESAEVALKPTKESPKDEKLRTLLSVAVEDSGDENGWANLGAVGSEINKYSPDFDPRNYGYRKLSDLIKATGMFEFDERDHKNSQTKTVYVRLRRK
ncbi:MAG TPA: NYN domain-containing protein [Campylobacterales bacterium]|nr:NYN domain-containing protein [Campylobacterales bacterium]